MSSLLNKRDPVPCLYTSFNASFCIPFHAKLRVSLATVPLHAECMLQGKGMLQSANCSQLEIYFNY